MRELFFQFSNLRKFSEISHAISNRNFGDMGFGRISDNEVIHNRQEFLKNLNINLNDIVVAGIAHDSRIVTVGNQEKSRGSKSLKTAILKTDGLITSQKQIFLMVTVADCLPIFFYDPSLRIVGLLHAGWRGILAQIVPKALEKFNNCGTDADNLIVGIGPGICQRHFVVQKDVLDKFKEYNHKAVFIRNHDGYVDLKKTVLDDLKNAGVLAENIEISSDCPVCHNGLYGSFRKEGAKAPVQAAIIGLI
ncbi:MAG: peptidoglycan editing factor PgeF [Patescibacteria group bacterium]